MGNRFTNLRCKEVINICDGCRLGYVSDVELDLVCGKVVAILVPGPCRFFGLFGRDHDYVIPWNCIKRIGGDIILVDVLLDQTRTPRGKRRWACAQ